MFVSFEFDWIRSGPRGNRRFDPPSSSQPRMRYPFSGQLSCGSQYPQFDQLKLSLALGAQPARTGIKVRGCPIASSSEGHK